MLREHAHGMDEWQWLLTENVTTGAIIGFLVGALVRLATKAVQFLLIAQFLILKLLEARGIVMVDWDRLTMGVVETQEIVVGQASNLVDTMMEMGVFGASLAVGFYIGQRLAK